LSKSAFLAGFGAIALSLVPFVYFWQGRDPDLVTNYIFCNLAYKIEERLFAGLIVFLWFTLMNYVWFNFSGDVRRRLIVAGTIHVYFQYLLGRTFWRPDLHLMILFSLVSSTVFFFILSRKWNWLLIAFFLGPPVFAFLLISSQGGSMTDKKVDRMILWVYAIATHWSTFVFVYWLFAAPKMKSKIARFDIADNMLELNSSKRARMI
jgi:hypothetical protein